MAAIPTTHSSTAGFTLVTAKETVAATPGLARHLSKEKTLSVVQSAVKPAETLAICQQLAPCILIVDEAFVREIQPSTLVSNNQGGGWVRVIAVIDDEDPATYINLLRMGCAGAMQRTLRWTMFRRALQAVVRGELWAPRQAMSGLIRELLGCEQPRQLTLREREIFLLMAEGCTNQQIADRLFISKETVRWHLRTLYGKLGVEDRQSAMLQALSSGLVPRPKPPGAEVAYAEILPGERKTVRP